VIEVTQIESPHLSGNLIGDPSRRDLVVYLPPGYAASRRRYPVAYLLHGFGRRATSWIAGPLLERGSFRPSIEDVVNEAIAKRGAAEMIVVMPDGWSRWGCSQWVDSPVNGNFEHYVTEDIVEYVDSRYRTIPASDSRGVFGISSGGLGAWHLGSRNPDVFGAMLLLSADSYFEFTHKPWLYRLYTAVYPNEPNGPINGLLESWFSYGLASCYTPNVAKPPFFVDFPIEFPSGEIIPDRWNKWLAYDPVVSWRPRSEQLRRLRGIRLDVGYNDEYDLQYGHRILSRAMAAAGIAHEAVEHDGTHGSRLFERIQLSLEWFSRTLRFES
jgi:pimeloyl-ACP methyl ester carboxylesterase